jgi:hypothetical protein
LDLLMQGCDHGVLRLLVLLQADQSGIKLLYLPLLFLKLPPLVQ